MKLMDFFKKVVSTDSPNYGQLPVNARSQTVKIKPQHAKHRMGRKDYPAKYQP